MSQKFTAEEVRALAGDYLDASIVAEMLHAHANLLERIKADEGAVPFGYAYRYADGIKVGGDGRERNGMRPTEVIPLFTHPPARSAQVDGFDMLAHLQRQREWSGRTFGPGTRAQGVVDHIRKELREIEADPGDLNEWIDVVILALDGAWRSGAKPEEIIAALAAKQTKNEGRVWPDWRTADPNKAIEHDRSHDAPTAETAAQGRWGDESTPFNDWWDSHRAAHATNVHLKALAIAAWTASRTYHECAAPSVPAESAQPTDSGRVSLLNGEMLQAGADALEKYVAWEAANDEERYACVESMWRAMQDRKPTAEPVAQPADSGRVGDETATVASMRAELVAKIGDCCMGGDPLCTGGCLAEKAAKRNAEREAALAAQGQSPASPTGVPKRWVLVPARFGISKDAWEAAQFAFGGPGTGEDEEFMDCTAWIGEIENDDGSNTHGIHIQCDECPEEGSIMLAEFAAAPSAPEGDA